MRNKLVAAAITGLVAAPSAHAAADVSWFGFSQITMEQVGENANGDGGGYAFGADRIRIGYKAKFDSGAHSKLQVDFNRNMESDRQLPRVIKDALVGYDFGTVDVQAGMRKTPVGMDFNTSGKKLDITKRGMEKDYVTERTAGLYVFGGSGPIGYAVWYGNAATRSSAVNGQDTTPGTGSENYTSAVNDTAPSAGSDASYGGRVSYDMGKMLHAELSYGVSTLDSNVNNTDDYSVLDIGLKSQPMPNLTLKAEYLSGTSVNHTEDRDQTVWYLHGGYEFTPMVEGVLRHYNSKAEGPGGGDNTLANTWVGANIFLNPEKHHEARIQLNYVMASGDTDTPGTGSGSFAPGVHRNATVTDDNGEPVGTFLAQFQTAF